MARRTWTGPIRTGAVMTGADWANYIENFHNALIACGLTVTSDTGQLATLNPGTYVAPTTISTLGYRMYRLNDTLSATSPVFIKVTFRCSSGRIPAFDVQAGGPTTNGAGEILNKTTSLGTIQGSSTPDYSGTTIIAGDFPSYVSVGDGYVAFALGISAKLYGVSPSYCFHPNNLAMEWFVISRPSDATGNLLPDRISVTSSFPDTALSGTSGYTTQNFLSSQTSCVKYGYPSTFTRQCCAAVSPESIRTISGSAVVARCYGDFKDSTLSINPALGGYHYTTLANGDTTSLALVGTTAYEFIAPGVGPVNMNPYVSSSSDSSRGAATYNSALFRWDGPTV